jgi:hypothetical protein
MLKSLYVIGGEQRAPRSLLDNDQQWYDYQRGLIYMVDLETRDASICADYVSPLEARGADDPVLFKSGTIVNDRLFVCTQTEVLIYALPKFERVGYVSLPSFNDVHHVRPTPEGNLLVANSGLEMVLELSMVGEVIREWNVLGEEPWGQFSRKIDYRKGVNLKPHRAHPNYVFYLGDEPWVTRFELRDAISLVDQSRRIDIGIERVHDGVREGDFIYFTTVNGYVVVVQAQTLKTEAVVNLNAMNDEDILQGWCRGLTFDGPHAWIGFSRIRPTKFREAVSWVRIGFTKSLPTHVACYNLGKQQRIDEFDMEACGLNAVFSIFPGPK